VQAPGANGDFYYYYNSAYSSLNVGKTTKKGILSLWLNGVNTDIIPSGTAARTITLPDVSGTVYTTGNKPTYSDVGAGSAIKSITRSGTTFTYTCLNGSTGTFTQ
jgi:hypothetical protein